MSDSELKEMLRASLGKMERIEQWCSKFDGFDSNNKEISKAIVTMSSEIVLVKSKLEQADMSLVEVHSKFGNLACKCEGLVNDLEEHKRGAGKLVRNIAKELFRDTIEPLQSQFSEILGKISNVESVLQHFSERLSAIEQEPSNSSKLLLPSESSVVPMSQRDVERVVSRRIAGLKEELLSSQSHGQKQFASGLQSHEVVQWVESQLAESKDAQSALEQQVRELKSQLALLQSSSGNVESLSTPVARSVSSNKPRIPEYVGETLSDDGVQADTASPPTLASVYHVPMLVPSVPSNVCESPDQYVTQFVEACRDYKTSRSTSYEWDYEYLFKKVQRSPYIVQQCYAPGFHYSAEQLLRGTLSRMDKNDPSDLYRVAKTYLDKFGKRPFG